MGSLERWLSDVTMAVAETLMVRGTNNQMIVGVAEAVKEQLYPGQNLWLSGPFTPIYRLNNFERTTKPAFWKSGGRAYGSASKNRDASVLSLRQVIKERIRSIENTRVHGLLLALVLGEKHQVSTTTRAVIRNVGADHLFAVSALHIIGLSLCVGWLVLRFSFLLNLSAALWLAVLSSLSWAVIMLMLCDFPIGGLRAIGMFLLYSMSRLFGHRSDALERLYFVAVAVLWFQPDGWKDPGVVLSFLSVYAILEKGQSQSFLGSLWSTSFWSSVVTAPACTFFFGGFAWLSPLTNLVLVPLISLIVLPSAWLGVLLSQWSLFPLSIAGELVLYFVSLCQQFNEFGSNVLWLGSTQWISIAFGAMILWCRAFIFRCVFFAMTLLAWQNNRVSIHFWISVKAMDPSSIKGYMG